MSDHTGVPKRELLKLKLRVERLIYALRLDTEHKRPALEQERTSIVAALHELEIAEKAAVAGVTWAMQELDRATGPVWNPALAAKHYLRSRCSDYCLADKLLAERTFKRGADLVLETTRT